MTLACFANGDKSSSFLDADLFVVIYEFLYGVKKGGVRFCGNECYVLLFALDLSQKSSNSHSCYRIPAW